jgi:glycerol-3-phosphate O-acyltransferase
MTGALVYNPEPMSIGNKGNMYLLQGDYGFLLGPVMRRLFSQITIPDLYKKSVSGLAEKGHIVFVHSISSTIDGMLMNYRFAREGLPSPKIVFGRKFFLLQPMRGLLSLLASPLSTPSSPFENDFYKEFLLDEGNASLISLDMTSAKAGIDAILELLKIQRDTDRPIYLLPQRIVYRRAPLKVKDVTKEEKASIRGTGKLMTLIRAQEHGFLEHGEPINLKDVIKKAQGGSKFFEEVATEVRNDLGQQLASLGRNISGAPIRERGFLIRKTAKDPVLQTFLRSHSAETGQSIEKLEATVYKHLDQIASDLSPSTIGFLYRSLTWVFNNIYEGLDMDDPGIQAVRETARNGSLVYVPCHKSHIDYLILSYCLFQNWMSVPVVAAGINLSFFPIGTLLRKGGAFFMKRTFKDNPLYSQTFAAYVRTILQERIPMEFFIEGGRSRSGKLMLPKKGLLSMIIQGWESGVSRDVIFVPVYVGYDTVVEESSYIREMKGDPKQKESFWQLLKAGSILKNRYGKVYIRFASPISLNDFMKTRPSYSRMDSGQKEDLYDTVASTIISSIYQQTVATPISILSCVITSHDSAIEEDVLRKGFHTFRDYLSFLGCNMSSNLADEQSAFDEAYALIRSKKLITLDVADQAGDSNLLVSEGEDRIHLEYYKNTILNFFVPASLISNVLLKYSGGLDEKMFRRQVQGLAALLENEFILDMESLEKALKYLIDSRIIIHSRSVYTINPENRGTAVMFDGLLENYLESYLCAARYLLKVKDLGKKDPLKAINKFASRIYKKGEIRRYEALCLPVYKGALDTFRKKGLINEKNRLTDEKALHKLISEVETFLEN